jgi:hypothetical protein
MAGTVGLEPLADAFIVAPKWELQPSTATTYICIVRSQTSRLKGALGREASWATQCGHSMVGQRGAPCTVPSPFTKEQSSMK